MPRGGCSCCVIGHILSRDGVSITGPADRPRCDKEIAIHATGKERLAERFEAERGHLRAIAYRMLGSMSEADDAIQEAWIRLSRTDASEIDNLRAWLTTVVSRVALNILRSRRTHREASLDETLDSGLEPHVPDPIVSPPDGMDPEAEAILGDSLGLALMAVLDTLSPPERVAFVLHDAFGVPFEEIAPMLGKTPAATRQLASRGRRRVRGAPVPDTDLAGQWAIVDAFLAASRAGDFEGLLALLDPDVLLRSDGGPARPALGAVRRGAPVVAGQAFAFRQLAAGATRALVNGVPGGIAWARDGRPFAVIAVTVARGRIIALDILADPDRLERLDLGSMAR
ncbi:MAG TPA: sigma-70 family RNA polymerase sigma factor [Candidatus Limnocylindrales bacterium]|nr:sigma-70 family RNA polymerase sigma factor [Candidatus Limnocylindrales bacterium]